MRCTIAIIVFFYCYSCFGQQNEKQITNNVNKLEKLTITGSPTVNIKNAEYLVGPIIYIVDSPSTNVSTPKVIDTGSPDTLNFVTNFKVKNEGIATNCRISFQAFYIINNAWARIGGKKVTTPVYNRIDKGIVVQVSNIATLPDMPDSLYVFVKIEYNKYDPKAKDKIGLEEEPYRETFLFTKGNYNKELPTFFYKKDSLHQILLMLKEW
jgi:hypothetical protein